MALSASVLSYSHQQMHWRGKTCYHIADYFGLSNAAAVVVTVLRQNVVTLCKGHQNSRYTCRYPRNFRTCLKQIRPPRFVCGVHSLDAFSGWHFEFAMDMQPSHFNAVHKAKSYGSVKYSTDVLDCLLLVLWRLLQTTSLRAFKMSLSHGNSQWWWCWWGTHINAILIRKC